MKNKQNIFNYIKNNIGIFAVIIGILGLTWGIYSHLISIKRCAPTYFIHPGRTKIIDLTGPTHPNLQILYRGNLVSERNVTALRLYFWNDGQIPIKRTDILDTLRIEMQEPAEILEARILKHSRSVIKFRTGSIQGKYKNILPLSFDILEQGDGAALQIIYSGDPNANISIEGAIVGATNIKLLESSKVKKLYKYPSPQESFKKERRGGYFLIGTGFVTSLLLGMPCFLAINKKLFLKKSLNEKAQQETRTMFFLGLIIGAIMILMGSYMIFTNRTLSPGVPLSIWVEE